MISVGENKSLETIDNLIKICPTCHKALKKNIGTELIQKEYISMIINNNKNVLEFAMLYFNTTDKNLIINYIYKNLN